MGKFFNTLYRIYAWVWNHFWGTLLIFGGVVGLMNPGDFPWYVPFCAIAAGIYFYWSPAWSKAAKKTANKALAQTPLEDEAGAVAAIETTLGIKSHTTEIKQVIAEPLVMESTASVAEVEGALDAIVNAKKGAPGFGAVLYELERTEGKITYAMGNQFYPQQFVVQVGLCKRNDMTEVAIKVLSVRMKDGRYVAANPMMMLRESVVCAVNAASDPDKMAEAVRFYGPPEPGSPRAIADRNKKIMLWGGAVLVFSSLYKFADGVYMNEIPLWFVVLAAGGGCIWFAERRGQRRLSGRVGDTETIDAQPAITSASTADGQPANAPGSPVAGAMAALSGLDSRTKSLLFIGLAVVVLVGGGIKITQSAQAAWNYKLEGDYAQREADGIAQMEADERAQQEALEAEVDSGGGSGGGDYTSADYSQAEQDDSSGEGTTPNGHSRWMQLPDIISMAPEDGSVQHTFVTYTAAGGDGSSFILEIDDISLGGSDPSYIHDVQLFGEDFGSCYVNDQPVSADEFLEFAMDNWGALGSIEFNQDAIVRANAYSEDYVPADGY